MNEKTKHKLLDALYIAMMVLPVVAGILLKILTSPAEEGISIRGAQIYFSIDLPLQPLMITEAQVNSALVLIILFGLCLYLTHGIKVIPDSKRQIIAEWIVEEVENLVSANMGDRYMGFAPFIAAIMGLSACSSLVSLFGIFPPTSDINVIAGWSILVFILITHYKLKGGAWNYVKGYFEPIPVFAPLNLIGEVATPVSMTFRHFGNVLSGVVISTLIGAGLSGASGLVLGWLPGVLGEFPLLRIGLPAIFSIYFDLFSGCLQAFIFAMLTMLNIANGFPEEAYEARMKKKAERARRREELRALASKS